MSPVKPGDCFHSNSILIFGNLFDHPTPDRCCQCKYMGWCVTSLSQCHCFSLYTVLSMLPFTIRNVRIAKFILCQAVTFERIFFG